MRISDWSSDVCSSDLDGAIGRFVDLVMRQRAVGAGGRDGVERQVDERAAFVADCAQLRRGGQFVEPALRRELFHPSQEARDRVAVAHMRSAGADAPGVRPEEPTAGKAWVRTCNTWCEPERQNKKTKQTL